MTLTRSGTIVAGAIGAIMLAIAAFALAGQVPGFVRITPEQVHWQDVPGGHGVQAATLIGDPNKPGMYVVRVKFPPYLMDLPHWHPHARYVTVLQGTWYTGIGDQFDVSKAVALKAGGFMMHPAKAVHWDGSAGNETVIVQIIGYGPTRGGQVDPKKPFFVEVAH